MLAVNKYALFTTRELYQANHFETRL